MNKEETKIYQKAWQAAHKERKPDYNLKWRYGMAPHAYDRMLASQGGACAICGRLESGKRLAVDHDHVTGKVRGLLCNNCNICLGGLENYLPQAASYLSRFTPRESEAEEYK